MCATNLALYVFFAKTIMKIALITNEVLKSELLMQGIVADIDIIETKTPELSHDTSCYIDLLFDYSKERIELLKSFSAALIIVNGVNTTCHSLPENFIRINGWPTFLSRPITEAACFTKELKIKAETVLSYFNKTIEWTSDIQGFITPRVISMIINEAYYTIQDQVTVKEAIDTAMKLGTNYPYGPFEWSNKIGIKNIYELLLNLSVEQKRYEPCTLIEQEVKTQ